MRVGVDVPAARLAAGARAARRGRRSGRRSRRPRSSGCATSGSTTSSRPRPIRGAAPTRRSSATIYSAGSPYHRPSGGTQRDGRGPRRRPAPRGLRARPRSRPGRRSSSAATSAGIDVAGDRGAAVRRRGARRSGPASPRLDRRHESAVRERFVRVVHRPGSVQTEIRIGHRRRCRGGSRTSTRCRSWARSSAGCSTRA